MNDEGFTLERTEGSDVALDVLNEGAAAETVATPVEGTEEVGKREVTRTFQQEPVNPEPLVI